MRYSAWVLLAAISLSGLPALTGCNKEEAKDEHIQKGPDGSVKKDEKKVETTPGGGKKETETHEMKPGSGTSTTKTGP